MSGRKAYACGLSFCSYYLVKVFADCLIAKQEWAQQSFTVVLAIIIIAVGFFLSLITVSQLIQLKTGTITTTTETLNHTIKQETDAN